MPDSMMIAVVEGRVKVMGRRRAMVAAGPIPGKTPIKVPSKQPTRHMKTLVNVRATPKPVAIFWKTSINGYIPKIPTGVGILSQAWNM